MKAFGFVDGGFIRTVGRNAGCRWPNPVPLVTNSVVRGMSHFDVRRITYFDALPDEIDTPDAKNMEAYFRAIELLPDCALGTGMLRKRRKRGNEQKGVDTLIAVEMLVGAFNGLFDLAILLSGDADFVPVVHEVKRRGVQVVVASNEADLADDLRRAADRVRIFDAARLSALPGFVPPHP